MHCHFNTTVDQTNGASSNSCKGHVPLRLGFSAKGIALVLNTDRCYQGWNTGLHSDGPQR